MKITSNNFKVIPLRIFYKDSLTLIRAFPLAEKEKLKAVFNNPHEQPILTDDFNTNLNYDLRTSNDFKTLILDNKRKRYSTNQALMVEEFTLALKDRKLFSIFPLNVAFEASPHVLTAELANNYSSIAILTSEELIAKYFSIWNFDALLILDVDGNIIKTSSEVFKSDTELLELEGKRILNQLALFQASNPNVNGLANYFPNKIFLTEYAKTTLPKLQNRYLTSLYAIFLSDSSEFQIQKLDLFYLDSKHYLVKTSDISLPKYDKRYLSYVKSKTYHK